ncbi:MAG: hypothetical protein Q9168_006829 [Polycauliona sp. 1 TL-2023]
MAYPGRQFQQTPSSMAYSDRQAPYVHQQQQQQHPPRHVPQSRNRHERPYQEYPSRPDRDVQEPYRSDRGYGSPQWPEQSAEWSSEADQSYAYERERTGPNPSQMRSRPGAYQDQMNGSYDGRQPPASAPYSQNHNAQFSAPPQQRTGQQQQFNQPREYGSNPHSFNYYDGASPPVQEKGHRAPQEVQRSNGQHDRMYHNPPRQDDSESRSAQQQRPWPVQDGKSKNAGWSQGTMGPQTQQRAANSSSGRPKNSRPTLDNPKAVGHQLSKNRRMLAPRAMMGKHPLRDILRTKFGGTIITRRTEIQQVGEWGKIPTRNITLPDNRLTEL